MAMTDPAPLNPYATRWQALLAEHGAIQDELRRAAVFTKPISKLQAAQLKSNAARLEMLSRQLRALVDEWSAVARPSSSSFFASARWRSSSANAV
jgi:hypothetical protein